MCQHGPEPEPELGWRLALESVVLLEFSPELKPDQQQEQELEQKPELEPELEPEREPEPWLVLSRQPVTELWLAHVSVAQTPAPSPWRSYRDPQFL